MSGDVQPRKRKDKKRKKDDSTEQIPSQPQTPSTGNQNEDLINIHVHKEDGTGGGICAKIIFFFLFSALAVLIGLIITEHRGLTDLDTVDQESRFSQIFEGWIDNSASHDDEGDHLENSLEDDDHGDDEHESHDDEDEDHEDHEEEEEASEEKSVVEDDEDENDEESIEDDERNVAEDDEDENDEESVEDDDQVLESEEQDDDNDDESELQDVNEDEASEESVDDDEEQNLSQPVEDSVEEADEDEDDEENDSNVDDDNIVSQEETLSEENVSEQSQEDETEQVEEDETEQVEEKEAEQKLSKEEEDEGDAEDKDEEVTGEKEEDETQNDSRMVVKIGVGVALLVVAHVVLVRKWKSASPAGDAPVKEEPIPDLSRRNTIVVPPTLQEVEQDIEDIGEEEYSDEDGEVESDDDRVEAKSAKSKYQELRTTYTRSLTPDSEPEYQSKPVDADDEEYEEEEEDEEDVEEVDDEEEEEDESDTGEYEKEDDEDLLKRLEAKYGKLQEENQGRGKKEDLDEQFSSWKRVNVPHDNEPEESDSDKQSDADTYEYENITNKGDFKIKEKIDEAQKTIQNNAAYAIKLFDVLLQNYSSSPRSLYGKAQALDLLADQKRSNDLLQRAIEVYLQLLDLEDVPDTLFEAAANRCINRMRFIGNYNRAIDVHTKLITRFPEDPKHKNQLVVSYLTINKVNKARLVLQETLLKHPNDGFALVHYGFILKTADNNLNESISYMKRGIATKASGVIDGRFYFHLGDALARLGKKEEAMKVYEEGVAHKLFLSKYQRSLYNVAHLTGKPWWKKEETPYANLYAALENNWERIRNEGLSVLGTNGLFQKESENLKDTGDWKQFELFARGQKNIENCKKCPITCKIIEKVSDAKGCRRGQTKFSVMHPGTHVWPHCGPTNCRLRVHLGLNIPAHTYIRVANEIRTWENGKVFIFDDSFEHEVWHNGTTFRLVLIIDVWHPELTSAEKRTLSPI